MGSLGTGGVSWVRSSRATSSSATLGFKPARSVGRGGWGGKAGDGREFLKKRNSVV